MAKGTATASKARTELPTGPRDIAGNPIFAPTFEDDMGLNGAWEGNKYVATAGVLNIYDEVVTKQLKLRGGWYELIHDPAAAPEAVIGDYLEFSVVDKDDVLGLFGALGLTVGVDVLELTKFVRTDYINPWKNSREEFKVAGASDIVPGLYMRTYYNSTGTTNVNFKVVTQFHET